MLLSIHYVHNLHAAACVQLQRSELERLLQHLAKAIVLYSFFHVFPTHQGASLLTNGISTQHISIVEVNNKNINIKSSNINLDSTNLIGL